MVTYALARRMDGEAAELPLPSQVVALNAPVLMLHKAKLVAHRMSVCRKRRGQRFGESSPTAPPQGGMVIWSLLMP
jgi:hypothetical protein